MSLLSNNLISSGNLGILVGTLGFLTVLIAVSLFNGVKEWFQKYSRFVSSAATMPGPPALPIIGNALSFACSREEKLNRLAELSAPYDTPFRLWMGPKLFVCVRSPRDIEVILNSSIATYKAYEYRFLASYTGLGLFTESGTIHKAHRKLIMPMVNGAVLNTFLRESFDKHSRRCVESLESKVDTGEFDVMHFIEHCTLDIALEAVMGTPGTAQQGGYKGVINSAVQGIALLHERMTKVWLYSDWIYARTKSGKLFAKAMDVLHEFAETPVIHKKTEDHVANSSSEFSDKPRTAVLDRLIAWNAQSKSMDDTQLRDAITNVWMPAQDATAAISSFLFVMLGMHPEVQEKVRAEVREVMGDEDRDITMGDLTKLKYLEMVFKETVRLFPVGPIILRETQADLDFVFIFMALRDPKHWKEPEKFNPDRFLPENSAGRHPYAYVPFSGGIRGCIGQQYATALVKTLVARVIQKYKITSSAGSLDTLPLKVDVSIRSITGYKISITRV